ncbi:MAG: riboflavin synthase [Kofleriaceae bacterium]
MFTGLVEDIGTLVHLERRADAVVATLAPRAIPLAELSPGESICHDGACLTVTELGAQGYTVLAGAETLARTTVGQWQVGTRVNLERSLRLGDRLGGHWVTGHIDGTAALVEREDRGANLVLRFAPPPALLRYVVAKGSIAIAGVSLTVNEVDASTFSVAIIPHTATHTTLGELLVQRQVNLEVDVIAKHVEKLVSPRIT